MCIAYTRSPLPMSILAHIVSVENDTPSLEALESSIPTEATIIGACSNLVSIDSQTEKVRFVHFSVQEFLTSDRLQRTFSPWGELQASNDKGKEKMQSTFHIGHELAHRELARMFITMLSFLNRRSLEAYNKYGDGFQKLLLATLGNWPFHISAANLNNSTLSENDPLVPLVSSFFEINPPMFAKAYWDAYFSFSPSVLALMFNLPRGQQHHPTRLSNGKIFDKDQLKDLYLIKYGASIISDDRFAIHYATSVLDSVSAIQRLYTAGYRLDYFYEDDPVHIFKERGLGTHRMIIDSELPSRYNITPLYSSRSEEVAKFLLDNGASIEPHLMHGKIVDPLKFFAGEGNSKVTQLLLDRIVNLHVTRCTDAFVSAVETDRCDIEIVKLLLDKGADVNAESGRKALPAAVYHGRLEVVQLLLDRGADVNAQGGLYGNALQAAAYWGKLGIVQLLLDKGADVNTQGGRYGNALQAAIYQGELEVAQLLLDRGADVNAQGGEHGNALHAAAYRGKLEIAQLLLDKGADVNAQGGEYGNALQAAVYQGELEIVQLLLDKGADVNAQGGEYGNALQAAVYLDRVKVVQLLLDRGADVNTRGGMYGNALQAAVYLDRVKVVQLLLDRGADVNARGGKYGNALQAAAYRSKLEIVQLLLDKGADVNAQGGEYGNALQAAACFGELEIAQLLLDKGVDVNAQGGEYGNALQAAACSGKLELVQLLLDKGADVNAQGGEYGNALQTAAYRGKLEIAQLLLDKGADVNAQGGEYGNALQAVVYQGELEIVQLLLDKGVDVHTQGGKYGNALQAALVSCINNAWLQEKLFRVVELLLDHGADPTSSGVSIALEGLQDKNPVLFAKLMELVKSKLVEGEVLSD